MGRRNPEPGTILIDNVNLGIDPSNPEFQLLHSQELNREFRCQRDLFDFSTLIKRVFSLAKTGEDKIFFPVVVGSINKGSYLLAPPYSDLISPGMAIADLIYIKELSEGSKRVRLRYSKTFSDESEGGGIYHVRYRCAVHEPPYSETDRPCQGLVYRLIRRWPHFRNVDVFFLRHHRKEIFEQNRERLEKLLQDSENMWWARGREIMQWEFEKITGRSLSFQRQDNSVAIHSPSYYNSR